MIGGWINFQTCHAAKLRKYELRAHVEIKEYQRVEKEATSRRATLAKTVRDCLNEYFNLREELATAMTDPGEAGEQQTDKIIHTLILFLMNWIALFKFFTE